MKQAKWILVFSLILSCTHTVFSQATKDLSGQAGTQSLSVPEVQGKPIKKKRLTAVLSTGELLIAVLETDAMVLYSNEANPKVISHLESKKWFLQFHPGQALPKDLNKPGHGLSLPIFEDPPTEDRAALPKDGVHLTDKPIPEPSVKQADRVEVIEFYYDDSQQKTSKLMPSSQRGVLVMEYAQVPLMKDRVCLGPILWWGEGVTEEVVREGCRKNDFSFVQPKKSK